MKNSILLSFLILVLQNLHAQTIIKGNVVTNKKETVPGANIILQDTYDGTTSDVDGNFSFTTEETGKQILVVSFIGYESYVDTLQLSGETIERNVVLKEQFNELNAVVVTAGAFEASDEKKAAVLRPLDIVTTAGAQGDMYGALQTLPGATQVGNDDGLYVRGGSDYETKTIIDGLPVQNPYYSTVPDVPSRGRFAPFLFKGTVFSTGGYSAEYGQAMSSAIILETEEFPDFTSSGISLSPIFAGGYHVQKFNDGKTAFGGGMNYTNIGLYDLLFEPQTYEITKSVQAGDANIYFRQKTANNGIIKFYGQLEGSVFGVRFPDVDSLAEGVKDEVSLRSNYQYANISYKQILGDSWTMYLAGGYSHSGDSTLFDDLNVSNGDDALQTKATFKNQVTEKISFKFGGEYQILNNKQFNPFSSEYEKVKENYSAIFAESDIFITNDLAGRVGLRSEHSNIIDETNLAPRISLAYKTGKNSQVSVAYGDFYQTPQPDYLYNTFPYYTPPTNLGYEKATHYIANYQVLTTDRTFRVELYYKQYENLLSETELPVNGEIGLENGGSGYARGIDIFFRDKKTFENVDYWISYSFLDTKRKFLDFPIETQPTFAADHVVSLVYKQYISAIRTQFGATYRYISGFPYYDPFAAENDFLKNTSPGYHNFSVNASYLTSIFENFTVIFASVDNVFGIDQVYGYTYSTEDPGMFLEQRPPLKRTIFVGMFISILKQADREAIQEAMEDEEQDTDNKKEKKKKSESNEN